MKTFNPAVALLKIAMCYCVVACHFGGGRCAIAVSVPVFMLIAFYYSHNPAHGGGGGLV